MDDRPAVIRERCRTGATLLTHHVKYSSRLTKLVCGGAFFFLLILFALTMSDYLSRGWFVSPRGTAGAGTQVTIGPPPEPAAEGSEGSAEPAEP